MASSAANTHAEAGTYAVRLRLEEANGVVVDQLGQVGFDPDMA